MTIRDRFTEKFSDDLATKIEDAANDHGNGVNNKNKGADPFKWALLICIGYQCFEVERFRKHHGITEASYEDIKRWIINNAELDTHDGDFDYISLLAGVYDKFMTAEKQL